MEADGVNDANDALITYTTIAFNTWFNQQSFFTINDQ